MVEALKGDARVEKLDIAGPGFINFRVTDTALAERAEAVAHDPRAGAGQVPTPRRVVIDYAGPNVAKPMHVGHLRASIIGESLKRLFRFGGDEVWGDAHFGDWGFQMGLLIVAILEEGKAGAFEGEGPFPAESPVTIEDLDRIYPAASKRTKEFVEVEGVRVPNPDFDPDFRDAARRATAELQNGRAGYVALWRHMHDVSMGALKRDFDALNVRFDLWKGESDADHLMESMVEDLKAKGLAVPDQGALVVHVARDTDKAKINPLIVVSRDGSAMYGATDVATILDRREEQNPDLILYVVDQRQADHFEQVFRVAYLAEAMRRGRIARASRLRHHERGPTASRSRPAPAGCWKLGDLIEMATEKARAPARSRPRLKNCSPEAFEDTAHHKVAGRGAEIRRPVELSRHQLRLRPRPLPPASKAGPTRTCSTKRYGSNRSCAKPPTRARHRAPSSSPNPLNATSRSRSDAFETARRKPTGKRAPNHLAEHAYRVSQSFSKFYAACPVLAALRLRSYEGVAHTPSGSHAETA